MANINDYIDWRGDISFEQSPLNDVDNLIFSEFCFLDLRGIVPINYSDGFVTLSDATDRYFSMYEDRERMRVIGENACGYAYENYSRKKNTAQFVELMKTAAAEG